MALPYPLGFPVPCISLITTEKNIRRARWQFVKKRNSDLRLSWMFLFFEKKISNKLKQAFHGLRGSDGLKMLIRVHFLRRVILTRKVDQTNVHSWLITTSLYARLHGLRYCSCQSYTALSSLLFNAVGGDAVITFHRSAMWLATATTTSPHVQHYANEAARVVQDLCKSCRTFCCCILFWCKMAKFLHNSCLRVLFYFIANGRTA